MPNSVIIPDLIGGVSQLPQDQRDANQVDVLENALCSKSFGLRKRPPTESIGRLSATQAGWDNAFIYGVGRTSTERYSVIIANGNIRVFDSLTGVEQAVQFPNGKAYLQNNIRGFSAITVGDHTFIVNKDRVVKRGAARVPTRVHEALLFVRHAEPSIPYTVKLDGFLFSTATNGPGNMVTTDDVAFKLYVAMRDGEYKDAFNDLFTYRQLGSSVYIRRKDGGDFNIEVHDGLSDKGLRCIKGSVQSIDDLPERAVDGMVVEIAGDPGSPKDNQWVEFVAENPAGHGVWQETVEPGTTVDFDLTTMPHELVRQGTYGPERKHAALPRQPTYTALPGSGVRYEFSHDGSDIPIIPPTGMRVLTRDGTAIRSAAIVGSATQRQQVTLSYEVDVSAIFQGTSATLVLSKNTGAGWVEVGRRSYGNTLTPNPRSATIGGPSEPGATRWVVTDLFPTGTKFELRLIYNVFGIAVPTSRLPRITVGGSGPALTVQTLPAVRVAVGPEALMWPRGAKLRLTVDGTTFSYTLPDDQASRDVAVGIAAVVNLSVNYRATYSGPASFPFTAGEHYVDAAGFTLEKTAGGPPTTVAAVVELDDKKVAWDPDARQMVPGEHVGRILRNLSTGAEGLVTANSARAVEVAGLSGGTRNTFLAGDRFTLLDQASAYYIFKQGEWDPRTVGNDDLAPWPSFVDRRISEVFFHSNRLGFTAEDFVLMSASGDLRRFWRKSVTAVLDDDPIDIRNAHKDVGYLDSAVTWEGKLLLCSSSGLQFNLVGQPSLTPATVRLEHMSSHPQSEKCRPLAAGASVFIPRKAAGFSTLRELFVTRDGIDSTLCNEHAPRYIPGDTVALCGDSGIGFLALLPDGGDRKSVYVYNFGDLSETEHRQKAWSRWTFDGRVVGIDYFDGHLYLVRYRGSEVYLERIAVANPPAPTAAHRDYGIVAYTFLARLSRIHIADRSGNPVTSGRTQVHTLKPVVDSGDLRVEVTPKNRSKKYYPTGPRRTRVPVLAENKAVTIDLINDGGFGCTITGLEYEVSHTHRSR